MVPTSLFIGAHHLRRFGPSASARFLSFRKHLEQGYVVSICVYRQDELFALEPGVWEESFRQFQYHAGPPLPGRHYSRLNLLPIDKQMPAEGTVARSMHGTPASQPEPKPHGDDANEILIAEDDPVFRKILKSWLESWGYRVTVAEDGEQAWDILQQPSQPELLILDWVMPKLDGAEICHRIRERERTPYPYILLVTAKDDTEDVVAGLESGADDYLTKPFERNELRARLRVGKRILSLQDNLIRAREELRFQATHDVLTGIWNRAALLDLLRREIERGGRTQSSTGLLMLDLDHFKRVNDTLGHQAGDLVLQEVARRITRVIRSYDFLGRHGGEEFLVILPGCDRTQAEQSAERIRLAVGQEPIVADNLRILVTVSIGVTAAYHSSEREILAIADTALYQAKHAGRNCTVVL